jgi:hypothetical protein
MDAGWSARERMLIILGIWVHFRTYPIFWIFSYVQKVC